MPGQSDGSRADHAVHGVRRAPDHDRYIVTGVDVADLCGHRDELIRDHSLAPLEPLKAKINVIDGLFNKAATGQGIHPAMTGNMLSGVPIRKGSIIHGGITVDQVLEQIVSSSKHS